MAELLKLREADDPRDLIHRAVHRLVDGHLVALPTETSVVVAAHSLQPSAVERLRTLSRSRHMSANENGRGGLLLGLKSADEAQDYVLEFCNTAKRLMQRMWPGALVLALPLPAQHGLFHELPAASQQALSRGLGEEQFEVWIRVAAHQVVQSVLSLLPAPLVFWDSGSGSCPPPSTPGDWASDVDLIIEDKPLHDSQRPSVVRVEDKSWTVVEPGIVTETQITRMTGKVILFVCTGNTCRSPLAESLFRKLLADRLQCAMEELPERGYTVLSAGLAATEGAPAAAESVEVARQFGADLESHASQPLSDDLLGIADFVFTMTSSHRDSILFARPDVADRVSLLSTDDSDIPDPIGGGRREYETCGAEIARHLKVILNQLEPSSRKPNPES